MLGDIRAPRVVLVDGSRFKGSIDMDAESRTRTVAAEPVASKAMSNSSAHDHTSAYASTTKS
jgi:hypothetical protein